jgi:hypothetical protein
MLHNLHFQFDEGINKKLEKHHVFSTLLLE